MQVTISYPATAVIGCTSAYECCQPAAISECGCYTPDHTVRDGDGFQAFATTKCRIANHCDAVRNDDGFQTATILEYRIANHCDAIRNCN